MGLKQEIITLDGINHVAYPAVKIGNFFIVMFDESHIRTYQLPKGFDMNKKIDLSKLPYTDNMNI